MNPLKKYIQRLALKAIAEDSNTLFRQMFRWINTDSPIWVGEDQQDYIDKGYLYNDIVYSIIKTKADAAKSINWLTYKVVDEKALRQYKALTNPGHTLKQTIGLKRKALQEVSSGEVYRLAEAPNKYQTINEIVEEYFSWIDLMGNFYLYGHDDSTGKRFKSVHVMPAHYVEIIAGTMFEPIKGYRMKHWFDDPLPADRVLHMKNWNPDYDEGGSQLYGASPLRAGGRILTLDNTGLDTSATTFKNQGVRGFVHKAGNSQDNFSIENAQALKERFEHMMKDTGRIGEVAYTNAPAAYTEIGKSPVDLGILQAMNSNLQRLCNLLQVPMELFAPGSTFNNKAEARKHLITTGVLPRMNIFRDKINKFLFSQYDGGKYYVDYDLMSITELQDDLGKMVDMYAKMDWITDNEKREATNYGKYEHSLADTLFVDPNRIPIDAAMYDTGFDEIDKQLNRLRHDD